MPNTPTFDGLRRVNITIEGGLHDAAKKRAKALGLPDGFSGYVSRLLNLDQKNKGRRVANAPRRFKARPKNDR